MRTKIDTYIDCNGLKTTFDDYLKLWASRAGHELKRLPFKRDLRYWNNGPTSMQPDGCFAAIKNHSYGEQCFGVYEIWRRQDGFGMDVYKFDDMADYEAYSPSKEAPDAFKREIGMR